MQWGFVLFVEMKKPYPLFLFLLFIKTICTSQNLVPNPGFETNTMCNVCLGSINYGYIPPWDSPTMGTPDAYNTCAPSWTIPNCFYGYQFAHLGNGFAGIQLYGLASLTNAREYIQVELDSPLVTGQKYCVSYYVNLANSFGIANNNFGMHFSNTHTYMLNTDTIGFTPQINDTTIISDTVGWHIIYGRYTALGGERYIIIGNFFSNANTDTTYIHGSHYGDAYYYIDDVNVHCCSCDSTTSLHDGVDEVTEDNGINIYPNPVTNLITIELKTKQNSMIEIKDVLGRVVYSSKINTTKTVIDIGGFAKGVYFVEVGNERKKIVKE